MQSALLLAVPAAEAAVGPHRARLDSSALDGVPAHITVLYPFLPPAEIGPDALARLSRLFAGVKTVSPCAGCCCPHRGDRAAHGAGRFASRGH
jgi:hypothetical protein